jgi:hypothetical protein
MLSGYQMAYEIKLPEKVEKTYKNIKLKLERRVEEELPEINNQYIDLELDIPEKNVEIRIPLIGSHVLSAVNIPHPPLALKIYEELNKQLFAYNLQLEASVINIIEEMLHEYKISKLK